MAKLFPNAILRRLISGLMLSVLSCSAGASVAARAHSRLIEAPAPPSVKSSDSFRRQRGLTPPRAAKLAASFSRHNPLKPSLIYPPLASRFLSAPHLLNERRVVVAHSVSYRSSSLPCQGGRAPPASV